MCLVLIVAVLLLDLAWPLKLSEPPEALRAVRPGGCLVLETLASGGPMRRSSLPAARYDADKLATQFSTGFELVPCAESVGRPSRLVDHRADAPTSSSDLNVFVGT